VSALAAAGDQHVQNGGWGISHGNEIDTIARSGGEFGPVAARVADTDIGEIDRTGGPRPRYTEGSRRKHRRRADVQGVTTGHHVRSTHCFLLLGRLVHELSRKAGRLSNGWAADQPRGCRDRSIAAM